MDYEQALEWVHSLPRLAAHPGVENTRRLLEKLGNPEKSLRFVHVAGTNGKGSATVMLASVLHRAGYRVGASVSPYVLEFRERFLLDGEMISRETLAQILTEVRAAAEGLRAEGWDSLVEFDAVTAATLLWFARERCDIVCLEVGLGGRLDSTNAVENKIAALEGGVGALLTSAGQAASLIAVLNIAHSGDHIISGVAIYGGTFNLFYKTMKEMGIENVIGIYQEALDAWNS